MAPNDRLADGVQWGRSHSRFGPRTGVGEAGIVRGIKIRSGKGRLEDGIFAV